MTSWASRSAWRCMGAGCDNVKQPGTTTHWHPHTCPSCPLVGRSVHPLRYCDRCIQRCANRDGSQLRMEGVE